MGKQEEILLARHRHRWKNNIKMDLRDIGLCSMDWIHVGLG
jgi:hypothetical protein